MGKELNGTTLLGAYWSTEVVSGSGSGSSRNSLVLEVFGSHIREQ